MSVGSDYFASFEDLELIFEHEKINSKEYHRIKQQRLLAYVNSMHSYTIMYGDQPVVSIDKDGTWHLYNERLMPYNLYLEPVLENDIDARVQNINNFNYWCATRLLNLDREYAKEIMNSIGVTQAITDRDRAQIALTYNCVSLKDIYWVNICKEFRRYEDINLFENHLDKAFVEVSLRGKQMTVQNSCLIADDLGTLGCYPKAWIRKNGEFWLMKDGGQEVVENELLASKICRCFKVNQVFYEEDYYEGQKVSISKIMTSLDKSIVSMEEFSIYATNHNIDKLQYVLELDAYSYYMMNIVDYLIGNTDRHWGNWGMLVDNATNKPVRLHDLMDFNKAFNSYDQIEGANCLTTEQNQNQREAAIEAVKKIGLNQISEVKPEWFGYAEQRTMFFERLDLLKKYC